jgi:hypothetical protein
MCWPGTRKRRRMVKGAQPTGWQPLKCTHFLCKLCNLSIYDLP